MKFVIFVVVILFASSFVDSSDSEKGCTEVNNHYFDQQGRYSINVSAKFEIDTDPNYIIISNITVDYGSKGFSKSVCVVPNFGDILCLSDFTRSVRFPLKNETGISVFHIQVIVNNTANSDESYDYFLFYQVFDEGYFSMNSGEIFNVNQSCFGGSYYDRHGILQESLNQCCTAFDKPILESPKNLTACKKFKSRTTIYNVDDNYSIFATTQVNYTLNGKNITIHGDSMKPDEIKIWVEMNNYASCYVPENSNYTSSFLIPKIDSKFIVSTIYENSTIPVDYNTIIQENRIIIGRVLFRNGIALMAESDPFTPQNNCQYFNFDLSPKQVVSSSFCCTEF